VSDYNDNDNDNDLSASISDMLIELDIRRKEYTVAGTDAHNAHRDSMQALDWLVRRVLDNVREHMGALVPKPIRRSGWAVHPDGSVEGRPKAQDVIMLLSERYAALAWEKAENTDLYKSRAHMLRMLANSIDAIMHTGPR
jgi:hypothetical protein